MTDDDDASISNDEGPRASVDAAPTGESWSVGEHARLGLETVEGWSPPSRSRYGEESTAGPKVRGIDTLLPDHPREQPRGRVVVGYRAESTIGQDERVRIHETTKYPWRMICHLRIHSRHGDEFIGTGWLISPRTIVTAGHCVHLPEMGGWADRIVVSPARNGNDRPFSSISATKFHSVRGWTIRGKREHDYGVIVLPEDEALTDIGAFGYGIYDTSTLAGTYVNLAGYPADKDEGSTMWWAARRSIEVTDDVIYYDADTAAGQSGAPIWRLDPRKPGQRVVVGIHTNGARTGNSAIRINERVFANLERWTM